MISPNKLKPAVLISLGFVGMLICLVVAGDRLRGLLFNTSLLVVGTWAISLPIGALIAIAVTKTEITGRKLLQRLFVVLLFVPLYVLATAWQAAIGQGGWFVPEGANWLQGWTGAIWVHGMAASPWVVLFLTAALKNVPRELEEEFLQDARPNRVLWHVSLRRAGYSLLAAALWIAVLCAGEVTVTDFFQIRTFAEEVYTTSGVGTLPQMAAVSDVAELATTDLWVGTLAVLSLVVAALGAIWQWLPAADFASPHDGNTWRTSAKSGFVTVGVWLLVVIVVGVPLVALAGKAGMQSSRVDDVVVREWSPLKAANLTAASPYEHRRELGWTCAISGLAALLATMLGLLIGWMMRTGWFPSLPMALLLAAGFAIPGPLLGLWVIQLLNHPADSWLAWLTLLYDRTILAPVLVQAIRAIPLAVLILSLQLATVPQDLLDGATSEGAGWWRRLWNIALPLRWHAVLAAGCMSLIVAVSDLAATLLVTPPGVSTLSIRIAGLLHAGADDRLSALCLMVALVLGALASLAWSLVGWSRKNEV